MTRAPARSTAPPAAEAPDVDGPAERPGPAGRAVARALRALLGAVAALRPGDRAVHHRGALFAGTLEVPDRPWRVGVGALETPGSWPAVVRFSRGFGLPQPLPDVLGLAVRVESSAGPRDLLVDSVLGPRPWQRRIGAPAEDHLRATYGSILAYRLGRAGAPVVLLALPVDPDGPAHPVVAGRRPARFDELAAAGDLVGASFDLAVAGRGGGPVVLGRLRLGERLPAGSEPRFDPTATGELTPAGPLGRIRAASYPGSPTADDRRAGP